MKKFILLFSVMLLFLAGCGGTSESSSNNNSGESGESNNESAAGDFPNKSIEMIIPYGPGGATDIIFRLYAKHAEEHLGQTIVPVNMEGASTTRGSREVKNADPDGYTILASHDTIGVTYLSGIVDYSFDAFETIAVLTQTPNMPVVNKDTGWNDTTEFLDFVKNNPGEVKWGMTPGSTSHFFIAQLMEEAGLDLEKNLNLISYEGTGNQLQAAASGEIDGAMANYTSGKSYFDDGSLVPLGVTYDQRLDAVEDLSTLQEQGIDMVNVTSRGLFAPKGTPEEIVLKIEEAFKKASEDPELQEQLKDLGTVSAFKPHDEAKEFYDGVLEKFTGLSESMDMGQ